jgi:hypothetical protein
MSQNAKLLTPIPSQHLLPKALKTAENAAILAWHDDTLKRGFAGPLKKGQDRLT